MKVEQAKRVFIYDDERLDDPNPEFTEVEVLEFYSKTYPALNVGFISNRETNFDTGEIEFTVETAIGSKA
jgi:PRTRC genetic system protein C